MGGNGIRNGNSRGIDIDPGGDNIGEIGIVAPSI
jgi:hypothetical protein